MRAIAYFHRGEQWRATVDYFTSSENKFTFPARTCMSLQHSQNENTYVYINFWKNENESCATNQSK